jgi:hypothetical protein
VSRIRTLKPEILEDEKTARLSDAAYRMFTALIVLADDHGNVRANSGWLIGQIWWAHDDPPRVAELLRQVAEAGLIHVYTVRGQLYCHIRGWEKHQRVDNAGKPRVPTPKDAEAQGFEFTNGKVDCESPKSSASLREIPSNSALPPTSEGDIGAAESAADCGLESKPKRKPKARELPLPADWKPTPEHRELARERGADLELQARRFRAHAEANDRRQARWNASFTQWLLQSWPDRGAQPDTKQIRLMAPADIDETPFGVTR